MILHHFSLYFSLYFSFIISNTSGHIFMSSPPSRKNKYSDYYTNNHLVDYNIMAPLNTNGYIFPCKGFLNGPPTQTFYSNTITVTLEGSAIHGGGHCQFGITFDDTHFLVLKTVIRNCLIDTMTYQFTLPSNTPSGNITIFWTWVNAIGNREYYMECADIQVNNNNDNTNSVNIYGKELIIVDLPGYLYIPEFPHLDMYDGRELFINAKSYYINPNPNLTPEPPLLSSSTTDSDSPQLPSPSPSNTDAPSPSPSNTDSDSSSPPSNTDAPPIISIPQQDLKCDIIGYMRCNKENFDTCVYGSQVTSGSWLTRKCAPGTKCKEIKNGNIICDFFNTKT